MCDPVTCQYFNFADNGISGWKCCDGMTCTNGFDPTGMTCDVDCGSSGLDKDGMACGTPTPTPTPTPTTPVCTFGMGGWSCDDGTLCVADMSGATMDEAGVAGCDATCDSNGMDSAGAACTPAPAPTPTPTPTPAPVTCLFVGAGW